MCSYYDGDDDVGLRNPLGIEREREVKKGERICRDDEVEEEEE